MQDVLIFCQMLRSIMEAFICPRGPICPWCHGEGTVCDMHPDLPWGGVDPDGCDCGAPGMPCAEAHSDVG